MFAQFLAAISAHNFLRKISLGWIITSDVLRAPLPIQYWKEALIKFHFVTPHPQMLLGLHLVLTKPVALLFEYFRLSGVLAG